jgi:hypothetical protein
LGGSGGYKKGTSKVKNERSQNGVMPESMVRGKSVELNKEVIKAHLNMVVWSTVEVTLKALLDVEVDRLCKARR